jgi:hypothetical protein
MIFFQHFLFFTNRDHDMIKENISYTDQEVDLEGFAV